MMKKKILFVCLGNIFRSPIAHSIFEDLLIQKNISHKYTSDCVAISDYHINAGADYRVISILGENRRIQKHRSKQFKTSYFYEFDYILAMDRINFVDIELLKTQLEKETRASIRPLKYFNPSISNDLVNSELDIIDPYYSPKIGVEKARQDLYKSIHFFIEYLEKTND